MRCRCGLACNCTGQPASQPASYPTTHSPTQAPPRAAHKEVQLRLGPQARTQLLSPPLLIVSPLRRATQTGLLAFAPQVAAGKLPVLAHEGCHERGGRHTCDKRLSKSSLTRAHPAVSYALIEDEEDPLWGDGAAREPLEALARRGVGFVDWLLARPERCVAVAAHSAFLLALFNAVLDTADDDAARGWFATGEMRTVLLSTVTG